MKAQYERIDAAGHVLARVEGLGDEVSRMPDLAADLRDGCGQFAEDAAAGIEVFTGDWAGVLGGVGRACGVLRSNLGAQVIAYREVDSRHRIQL